MFCVVSKFGEAHLRPFCGPHNHTVKMTFQSSTAWMDLAFKLIKYVNFGGFILFTEKRYFNFVKRVFLYTLYLYIYLYLHTIYIISDPFASLIYLETFGIDDDESIFCQNPSKIA